MEYLRACACCGTDFKTSHETKIYCSEKCSTRAQRDRRRGYALPTSKPCICCGRMFSPKNIATAKFCSINCKRKHSPPPNRKKWKREHRHRETIRKRCRKYGITERDNSITLSGLIERDHAKCHICSKPVDANDYRRDERGFFIWGNNYPSIDHIRPLAKGGSHTWDNVKLAHLRCNGMKSANEVFETLSGQMKFAI